MRYSSSSFGVKQKHVNDQAGISYLHTDNGPDQLFRTAVNKIISANVIIRIKKGQKAISNYIFHSFEALELYIVFIRSVRECFTFKIYSIATRKLNSIQWWSKWELSFLRFQYLNLRLIRIFINSYCGLNWYLSNINLSQLIKSTD